VKRGWRDDERRVKRGGGEREEKEREERKERRVSNKTETCQPTT